MVKCKTSTYCNNAVNMNLSDWILTTIWWSGSLEAPANRGGEVSKITLKSQGRYKTVQQRLLLCVKFMKVLKVLPPFCDIPHEETHFAVKLIFKLHLQFAWSAILLLHSALVLNFPASKLSYKLLNYSCSYKNKAHAQEVMGSFCFLFAVKPAF